MLGTTSKIELSGLMVVTIRYNLNDEELLKKIHGTLDGGAQIIELREKNIPHNKLISFAEQVKKITERYKVPLIINDEPEIVIKTGAEGVHLGEHDMPVSAARKMLGKKAIIGASAYNSIQSEHDGASYIAMSSPFPSISKPLKKLTPPEIIRETKRRLKVPLFVIGGITPENTPEIMALGVDGIAVMSGIFNEEDTEKATRRYRDILEKSK